MAHLQSHGAFERRRTEYIQQLWLRASNEDSNLATDWLWLYTQLDDDTQRLYSLRKAHQIDPCDRTVRSLLARLEQALSRSTPPVQPCVQN